MDPTRSVMHGHRCCYSDKRCRRAEQKLPLPVITVSSTGAYFFTNNTNEAELKFKHVEANVLKNVQPQ